MVIDLVKSLFFKKKIKKVNTEVRASRQNLLNCKSWLSNVLSLALSAYSFMVWVQRKRKMSARIL